MIATLRLATLAFGLLAFASAAHAAETELPHITVQGTAMIKVVPDLMEWSLTVRNQGAEASRSCRGE